MVHLARQKVVIARRSIRPTYLHAEVPAFAGALCPPQGFWKRGFGHEGVSARRRGNLRRLFRFALYTIGCRASLTMTSPIEREDTN